jgi:hypothetical protein
MVPPLEQVDGLGIDQLEVFGQTPDIYLLRRAV